MWLIFLMVAWVVAALSCARLCRAAFAAAQRPDTVQRPDAAQRPDTAQRPDAGPPGTRPPGTPPPGAAGPDREVPSLRRLTLYEAAYLAGGTHRVADVCLVAMATQRRLHLAHTGWATVVDTEGHDDMERSVITAIGPEGQSRVPSVRSAFAAAEPVRALTERLVTAGLAVPTAARTDIASALRQVKGASALVLLIALATLLLLPSDTGHGPLAAWFALPLVLTLGTWAIARVEIPADTGWASPAGQDLLRATDGLLDSADARTTEGAPAGRGAPRRPADDTRAALSALALHGPDALPDPALRAALHASGA